MKDEIVHKKNEIVRNWKIGGRSSRSRFRWRFHGKSGKRLRPWLCPSVIIICRSGRRIFSRYFSCCLPARARALQWSPSRTRTSASKLHPDRACIFILSHRPVHPCLFHPACSSFVYARSPQPRRVKSPKKMHSAVPSFHEWSINRSERNHFQWKIVREYRASRSCSCFRKGGFVFIKVAWLKIRWFHSDRYFRRQSLSRYPN